ncbi:MAG: glycosyltransferase family 4 protein [Deltaproteobacteria bacterium]|nr:glycosyltransferase family 4 protein [Deltaproteobacteria bacterium]
MKPPFDKIKVTHIITRFDKGGSAENTFLTIRGLDKNRYDGVLIKGPSPSGDSDDPEARAAQANIAACEAHTRVISIRHLVRDLNSLSDLIAFFALLRIIRLERPRIIHTHTSKAGILGRWAAWFSRVPVIVHTPHGHVFWGYFGPLQARLFILLERWTASITDAIVTLTPQEKRDHLRFRIAPERIFSVIHSGVDLAPFLTGLPQAEARSLLGIPQGETVIGTVGRLTAVKGQEVLIRAACELLRRGERIFIVLLGEGELRRELEALTLQLGIADKVRFLGWRTDVAHVLAACDIFCLPSRNEGMGKALVEAMATGLPVVASDIGGMKDIVRPGENGFIVPIGDVQALAKAIARLCHDPEMRRRMGEAGRRMAPRYSSEEMIKMIDQLYGKLIDEHHIVRPLHSSQ